MNKRRSPADLREGVDSEVLEPYQPPRMLVRQANVDQTNDEAQPKGKESRTRQTWISKFSKNKSDPDASNKLSKRFAQLSSLDSTRSSSSLEQDSQDHHNRHAMNHTTMPLISITSNDSATGEESLEGQNNNTTTSENQRRHDYYKDYYGRTSNTRRNSRIDEDDDDDDQDAFEDAPLPMPYSSSSMARSVVVRQQTEKGVSYPSTLRHYEELLDDRQGMNDSEQHFTKGEKANRPSIDGSIISEYRMDPKKPAGGSIKGQPGGSHKRDKRRSKSPTSLYSKKRQSRRGFLGLASRLKLTKKHESIAKLQLSILNSGFVSLKTLDRDLQSFLPKERLSVKDFQERVRLMRKYEVLSNIEYRFASKYETYVCKHAQQETNQPKNNYKKCIPYDYNRVVLKTLPNIPDSDYVNASHVDSCLKPNAYIAAQGPNEFTIEDFWRMIWEQKTFVIVMLTKVFDFIRVMCNQYWPVEVNKPERYGSIEVTLLYEEPLADFVIRTIKISKVKGGLGTQGATASDQGTQDAQPGVGAQIGTTTETNVTNDNSKHNNQQQTSDSEEDDYEDSDETDISEDLVLNELAMDQNLAVRAPKFVASSTRRRRRESRGAGRSSLDQDPSPSSRSKRSASAPRELQRTTNIAAKNIDAAPQRATGTSGATRERPQPPNEFLHPLFNTSRLAASSSSLATSEPNTPVTPRTPSSAGLDRSSATRKAVKKKRRERVKNQRPKRTQFMVPTESQLLDDDDDDDANLPGSAGADLDDADDGGNGPTTAGSGGGRASGERIIYQFHYNSWASHTCPFISSLLHFRRRVRICMDEMSKSGRTGPTVVHCNDGCGRTGTYLCIDSNLELAEEDNVLDIYNYTRKMRQSRKFLIENLEQYKFVYDTIEEAIYCGKTWFPVSELHKRLKHKSQRNPITRKNEYLLEYEKICRMTSKFSIGDCAGGHRVENREKNRDVSTVPPDNFRPYLTSFQTNDSTDYINAVFVDGYTRSKEYIVTEWPLHRTISDFWSLIYDHDCNSVILLANPGESSNYPSFLPSEKELRRKFGPVFSAEMVSYTHYQNIKSWIYTINKKIVSLTEVIAGVKSEAKTTQVFQITCWPQGHRVPTSTNALVELMNMVERWRQRTTYGPVCVVSLNGKSRAGVYCAANVAIEQVVQHSEVDVFNAVKTVRRHRPQLIENMTEYKYCYDLILHYVLHYVNNQSPAGT